MRRLLVGTLLIITVGVGLRAYYNHDIEQPSITTGRVAKGDIVETVTATGTLQAVTTVLVGTQVSGTVAWLGADFNSLVHKGEVIARLDPALLDAEIQQSEASVAKASADVDNARVQITDADQKYARASSLAARQLIPQSDLDAAKIEVDTANAQLRSSAAQLVQAQASLDQAKVNREHTIIASPIDGMVISRAVDVGQTVAASLSSPTLFSIAADLTKMQVQTDVDESDIGTVQPGQPVTFTVDAYPNDTFTGRTTQVRLQPTVLQNVTTYTVMVDVPNPELKLKPGMTATAHIEVARRHDVVTVPTTSLRFTPTADELAALGLAEAPPLAKTRRRRRWPRLDAARQHPQSRVGPRRIERREGHRNRLGRRATGRRGRHEHHDDRRGRALSGAGQQPVHAAERRLRRHPQWRYRPAPLTPILRMHAAGIGGRLR